MSLITESAEGENCQIRLPNHCNYNPETTILCHLNGAGLALKHHDILGAYGCSSCHDVIDGRVKTEHSFNTVLKWFYEAVFRTQLILIDKDLIKT